MGDQHGLYPRVDSLEWEGIKRLGHAFAGTEAASRAQPPVQVPGNT